MDWYKVGWVKDAHGLKGELYVQLHAKKADWSQALKTFSLKNSKTEEMQTLTVKRIKPHKFGVIVLPEGFSNRNQSEAVKGFEFYIPKDILVSREGDAPYLIEVLGFRIVDQALGDIGAIEAFESNGAQDLLVVSYQGRQVLVPFVDAWVIQMDRENKTIQMDLPPGLLDEN